MLATRLAHAKQLIVRIALPEPAQVEADLGQASKHGCEVARWVNMPSKMMSPVEP